MPLERLIGQSTQVFQKRIDVTEDTELGVNENVVVVGTLSEDITITLPPVGEAVGKIFTVHAPSAGTDTQAVTLEDKDDDSVDFGGDYTLDADNDRIALFSDGRVWWVIDNQIA